MAIPDLTQPNPELAFLDLLPLPVLVLDAGSGELIRSNRPALDLLGASVPRWLEGFLDMEGEPDPAGRLARAAAAGEPLRAQRVCLRVPGRPAVEVDLTLERGEVAENAWAVVSLQPVPRVSERSRLAEIRRRLAESEDRHRAFFETTPDGIMIVDDRGYYVEVNASMARMLRTTPQEMVGRHFREFIPADYLEQAQGAFGDLLQQGGLTMEFPLQAVDGTLIWCEWASRSHFVPGLHFCVAREITARREAETALRESEERFAAIVNHSPAVIFLKDAAGRYILVNPQFERLIGRPAAEVVGLTDFEFMPLEVAQRFREDDRRVLEAGEPITYEESFEHDGRRLSFITTKFPLQGLHGHPIAVGAVATNITARRDAEEALRDSEARYRLASEAGRVGVWDWQVGSPELYISPELRGLLGYTAEELPDSLEAWCALVHPEDKDRVIAAMEAYLEGRTPAYEAEVRRRHRCGEYRWFLTRGTAQRDESGQAYRLTGSDTDIHDRKAATETLQQEHNLRKAIEDAIVDGVAAIDVEGRQSYVNPAFCRMVGFSAEEMLGGTPPYAYWPEEEWERIQAAFDATLRGEIPDGGFELRLGRKDGTRFDAVIKPAELRNERNEPAGWLVCMQDVTERKRAADNLRYVMDHAQCLLWHATVTERPEGRTGLQWEFDYFDEAAAQRFIPLELEPGESYIYAYYRHKPDEDKARVDRNASRAFLEGRPGYQHEFRLRRADGELRWLYEQVRIEGIGPGRWRAAGLCTDITERKRLEAELRRQMEALGEAGRRKDEFLAMLAHELRNPLGAISNAVHVLEQPDSEERARDHAVAVMRRQLQHQTRMVTDLLDASRLTRGLVELQADTVDLAELVRAAAEDCRGVLERTGRELVLAAPEEPVWVYGDPIRLAQVLGNLLHNAEKFTRKGDRVTVRLDVPTAEQACLSVSDTGHGITAGVLPYVFESFVQGDRTLARTSGGLGLGLALVRGLVELHGGTVRAESHGLGKGAHFYVELPLTSAPAHLPPPRSPRLRLQGELRVLIIEDNSDAAETLQELLEGLGCKTDVALNGRDGLRAAGEFRPEIVLCDIGLPGMDGYEVATRLRRLDLPLRSLIAVTGYGGESDRRRSREAGFDEHLTKPVDIQRLQELLAAAE